jgi:hypothetical protein
VLVIHLPYEVDLAAEAIISFINVVELTSTTAENMFSWAALAVWKACTVLQVHFDKHDKLSGMAKRMENINFLND